MHDNDSYISIKPSDAWVGGGGGEEREREKREDKMCKTSMGTNENKYDVTLNVGGSTSLGGIIRVDGKTCLYKWRVEGLPTKVRRRKNIKGEPYEYLIKYL